jgi:hypothetical protein
MSKKIKPCIRHGILKKKERVIKKQRYKGVLKEYSACIFCYKEKNLLKSVISEKNRTCITCRKLLSDEKYTASELNKKWRTCKDCKKIYTEKRKIYQKNIRLISEYGITIDDYNLMLLEQNHVCCICKKHENIIHYKTKMPKELSVDHCHSTGKVRGLLCSKCNIVIGNALDDISILESAILYLKKEIGK